MRTRMPQPEADDEPDVYGVGGPNAVLQHRVAELLGKPAARFVIKGVIAQQAALRSWCERSGRYAVALHPATHIAADEDGAFEQLPLRRAGFRLPPWPELVDVSEWCAAIRCRSISTALGSGGIALPP